MADLNHVVIIGGGIGGLCLAHGLKQAGVNATVYERDHAITDRLQGYRVHISPKGSRALHDCLAPALFDTLTATCGRPPRAFRMLTERMQTLISVGGFNEPDGDAVEQHRSVSRITLRQVLLAGLDDVIRFGKTFERYEEFGRVAYSRISPTARLPRAISWSPRMAAVRACGGSSCLMPSASTPGSSV